MIFFLQNIIYTVTAYPYTYTNPYERTHVQSSDQLERNNTISGYSFIQYINVVDKYANK
jgi:hypothetical protein